MRKLRNSKRGLTFSLHENDGAFQIGTRYTYFVNPKRKQITIVPDKDGAMTVSRKKSGKRVNPLFDIRSKEVRNLVSSADYLGMEVHEDRIVVRMYVQKKVHISMPQVYDFATAVGLKQTGEVIIPKAKLASGAEYQQLTISDYLSSLTSYHGEHIADADLAAKEVHDVFRVCSLFSGAGMFDYAFKNDPAFEIVYACDFDASACESYRYNIGKHIHCGRIEDVDGSKIRADVVIGGPCCQGYSNSNRQNITEQKASDKLDLVNQYIRIVKEMQSAKVFVIENVPNFITMKEGEYINRVLSQLSDYEITVQTVCDCELGGYTIRKRAIIIGSKIGRIALPDIKVTPMKTVWEALSKVDPSWYNYKDITVGRKETVERMKYVPQGGNWKNVPPSVHKFGPDTHSDVFYRLKEDSQAPTIVNWRKINMIHPTENRTLSVAEASALQGFDQRFRFYGTLNDRQQQCGNGVPYAIASAVCKTVKKALLKENIIVSV